MKIKIWLILMILETSELLCFNSLNTNNTILPEDSIEFNGHTYKYYEESTDWYSAKEVCEGYGGHLVTITSVEENDFLIRNLPNFNRSFYWIGATDETQEGIWEWTTGETFSFNNWSKNSPNNNHLKEHYAGLMSKEENYDNYPTPIGSWNDFEILPSDKSGFICEWDFIKEKEVNDDNQQSSSQYFNKTDDKLNGGINITFHIDNLSLIGGVSIFGGISFIGFVIKKYKKRKKDD